MKSFKVHIFWEGHKILRNLPLTFDCRYGSQNIGKILQILWPSQNIWTLTKLTNTYLHFVYRHLTVNLCHLAAFLLCLFQHLFLHFHLAISIWPESDRNILCLDSDFSDDLPADRIFLSFCLLENWLEAVQIQPEKVN